MNEEMIEQQVEEQVVPVENVPMMFTANNIGGPFFTPEKRATVQGGVYPEFDANNRPTAAFLDATSARIHNGIMRGMK